MTRPSTTRWADLIVGLEHDRGQLVAPDLLWSEVSSVLHEAAWRGSISPELAREALELVQDAGISSLGPRGLRERAWEIADRMGWAKTYDAEYCALAELVGGSLVTQDRRLRAAGARLGYVWTIAEAADQLR